VGRKGGMPDAEAIRAHLLRYVDAKRISKYAVPEFDRIVFVDEIPKTSVGKINKKLLRERAA
jgi:fatty-acyl-CoA synthase